MKHLTIRTKIFLSTVLVSLSFIVLTLFASNYLMSRMAADEAAHNLRIGQRAYDRFISLRHNLIATQARSLAQTPHLRAVMNIPAVDHQTVWYTTSELFKIVDVPWMLLTDASGKLLANAADADDHGQDLSWQPCVDLALRGEEHVGIWYRSGILLRIVAVPIVLGEQILGTLVLGEPLDNAHAHDIRELTGRNAAILHGDDLNGWSTEDSTALPPSHEEIALLQNKITAPARDEALPITSDLGGRRSLVTVSNLADAGDYVVLFQALSELESGITAVRNAVLVAGALSIVLAILLSIWVSFRIGQPIRRLEEAAERLGSGQMKDRVAIDSQDELGRLASAFNTMADRLRVAYEELETANRDLEGRVEERTRSLRQEVEDHTRTEEERLRAETELELQRALSVRSDRLRSLGEMAAGIAHELNQPLVGVRGLAEHMLIGIDKGWDLSAAKFSDRLSRIVEQADRMTHIIEHVRLFAREAGKPEVSQVSINEVVKSSVGMLEAQFRSMGIDLHVSLAEELPAISANGFSLEEVLLNLLSNARDATEALPETVDRDRSVKVGTELVSTNGTPAIKVTVRDAGIGISEADMDRVLDPFFTTKGPDRGTGLGLPICKSIIEGFGGSLEITSDPAGTEVQVLLPSPSSLDAG